MYKFLLSVFLVINLITSAQAQYKGRVIDKLTNEAIPYANIHILGKRTGTTSDTSGQFVLAAAEKDTAVFSAIGYEVLLLAVKDVTSDIVLNPIIYNINEVTVRQHKRKYKQVGEIKRQFPAYHWGARKGYGGVITQHIAYKEEYAPTPFISSISFLTHSSVKKAKFNVRLYSTDTNGKPDSLIYHKNIIAIARKGSHKTKVELVDFNIRFPKSGLSVAIERLNIPENFHEYTYTSQGSRKKHKAISLEPSFSLHKKEECTTNWFYWGKWYPEKGVKKPIQIELLLEN